MKRKFSERHQLATVSELNVTPLLDLAFVLLIIFMITTPLIENSTDLVLPTGDAQGTPANADKVHRVSIHADGHIALDGQPVSLEELQTTLAAHLKTEPDVAVLIRGHNEIKLQKFNDVVKAVKRAGVKKTGFADTPKSD